MLVLSSTSPPTYLPHRLPFGNPTATICERSGLLGGVLDGAEVGLDGVGDVLCSAWKDRMSEASGWISQEEEKRLTIFRAEKAFYGGLTAFNHVEVERRAEEPVAHEETTERRTSDVEDSCGQDRSEKVDLGLSLKRNKRLAEEREAFLRLRRVHRGVRFVSEDLEGAVKMRGESEPLHASSNET